MTASIEVIVFSFPTSNFPYCLYNTGLPEDNNHDQRKDTTDYTFSRCSDILPDLAAGLV